MKETPLFFQHGACSLFGILHQPAADSSLPAFVFCHPFGEEKLWAHRVFVSFARRLAAAGFPVLRFDGRGHGDSEGELRDSSFETALADTRCAIDHARRITGRRQINLLGLRLGATQASLLAEGDADIDALVLWAPVVDGSRYMQELLRTNLTTQMAAYKEIREDREALVAIMRRGGTVNVDGYELALPMYSQVSAIRLAGPMRFQGPCLIAQVERQAQRPLPELQQLAAQYPRATLVLTQEEPFWKEILRWYSEAPNLFRSTLDWLSVLGREAAIHSRGPDASAGH